MAPSPQFAIVIPSYNNARYFEKNLASVASQLNRSFHVYYIDDASTDGTADLVQKYIATSSIQNQSTLIRNKTRKGSLQNQYELIHTLDPHTVVVCLDGDDWFPHERVLDVLAKAYSNPEVWLTYGSFETEPPGLLKEFRCHPIDPQLASAPTFRVKVWFLPHLRTFYAKLFHLIQETDLKRDGTFLPMAGDLAYMFPMLEMASKGHFLFIDEVLYIYNLETPLNDYAVNREMQTEHAWAIRVKIPYKPLKTLF